ncbi:c-type cytochrome [Ancylobacter oerskovii]|nr:c-type cytochrome [Ancylobacter oerskovii]
MGAATGGHRRRKPALSPGRRRAGRRRTVLVLLVLAAAVGTATAASTGPTVAPGAREPFAPVRAPGNLDPAKVALGEALFSDPILSSMNKLSCNSCHVLSAGGTVNMKRTVGYQGRTHRFNAPTIFNVGSNYRLGWRGDFTSLEEQNERVLLDDNLMGARWPVIIGRLEASETYALQFAQAYGHPPDRNSVLDALATFQRSLATPNSAFDRYLDGDLSALGSEELKGYRLFRDYGCASCHQGSNLGGNLFQKFGIYAHPAPVDSESDGDLGRYTLTGREQDKGVFRVPGLRNVAVTAPYLHDGRIATLPEVVAIMGESQLGRQLSPADIQSLVAFLQTLTGEYDGKKLQALPDKDD